MPLPTTVTKLRATIGWIDDPEAQHYQMPCKGCPDYCDLEDTDEATGADFGEAHCSGRTLIRRTTRWFVDLAFKIHIPDVSESAFNQITMTGVGMTEAEAELDAYAHFARHQLVNDPFDVPESSVRLRPCRSS